MNERYLLEALRHKDACTERYGYTEETYIETVKLVASIAQDFSVKKGSFLQHVGTPAQHIFILTKGVMRAGFISPNGEDVTVRFYTEGYRAFTSDLFFSTSHLPAKCFLVAETNVEGFTAKTSVLEEMALQHPVINDYRMKLLEYQVKFGPDFDVMKAVASAEEKLVEFREEYPGLEERISAKVLASYLRITPQYLSKLLKPEKHHEDDVVGE